ncbi:MAG: SGNH/GDSL hydrolase family protein [Clostridia bacterium]|nr:SGNH/GDSL hydrolase family protein [Clostridia bacterium]
MKILFQGDSITDAGRDKNDPTHLGNGYPKYAAANIAARHPDVDFTFYDLGISGNRAENLRDRWQADCIAYDPDFVSILIGVNDTWHRAAEQNWMPHEYFEECYRYCLEEIKTKTHAKILILEQFIVPTGALEIGRPDLDAKIQVTRKLAREYADAFIPLDGIFAEASMGVDPKLWAADGVHPTPAGAQLIADRYADAFDRLFPTIGK